MVVRSFRAVVPPDVVDRTADVVAALDREFSISEGGATLEVVGVHAVGRDLWIQLCNSDGTEAVVLRLRPDAHARDAVTALAEISRAGERFPRILDVVPRDTESGGLPRPPS